MTLEQLEMLAAIVNSGSFLGAAKQLRRSQPGISMAIKKLEDHYELQIFDRSGYRPQLTPAGKVLYESAVAVLRQAAEFHNKAQQLASGQEARLTISIDAVAPVAAVHRAIAKLIYQRCPTEISLQTAVLHQACQALLEERAELAIGLATEKHAGEKIQTCPYATTRLIPVISHKLLNNQALDTSQLEHLPQVIVSTAPDQLGGRAFAGGRALFVDSHAVKTQLILAGVGWGRVEEGLLLDRAHTLHTIQHQEVPVRQLEFHMMRHRERPIGPVAGRLWEELNSASPL